MHEKYIKLFDLENVTSKGYCTNTFKLYEQKKFYENLKKKKKKKSNVKVFLGLLGEI